MWIVVYRAHGQLNMDTQYVGPWPTHDEAYAALCEIPALGVCHRTQTPGVKFVQHLMPQWIADRKEN